MRKFLLVLFALLIVVAMTSCEPKVYHTPVPKIDLTMHDAPFSEDDAQSGTLRNYKSETEQPNILKFNNEYKWHNIYGSTSSDGRFLYVLRTVANGEATLEMYTKCPTETHENDRSCCDNCYEYKKYDKNAGRYKVTFYSLTPIMAYYFRFERNKYGFSTRDYQLGEAIQIKQCWNIGPGRKEIESSSDYLSGFIYFTGGYSNYTASVEAFCYRCEMGSRDRIQINRPSYIWKQVLYGNDSFNANGEQNEGWNNRISVLSGYASDGWQEISYFDYPESIAHYKDDMTKKQGLDGIWYEVIVTTPEK